MPVGMIGNVRVGFGRNGDACEIRSRSGSGNSTPSRARCAIRLSPDGASTRNLLDSASTGPPLLECHRTTSSRIDCQRAETPVARGAQWLRAPGPPQRLTINRKKNTANARLCAVSKATSTSAEREGAWVSRKGAERARSSERGDVSTTDGKGRNGKCERDSIVVERGRPARRRRYGRPEAGATTRAARARACDARETRSGSGNSPGRFELFASPFSACRHPLALDLAITSRSPFLNQAWPASRSRERCQMP